MKNAQRSSLQPKNPDKEEIKYEISDFLYHMMVLMVEKGVSWEEITKELVKKINYISFRKKAFVRRIRMNGYESFFLFSRNLKRICTISVRHDILIVKSAEI